MKSVLFASRLCQRLSPARTKPHLAATLTGGWKVTREPLGFFSTASFMDDTTSTEEEWRDAFEKATVGIAEMDPTEVDYATSAQRMRDLLKTGLLRHTDLRDNPERFFLAHRILATHSSVVGPGFWVRFTVHYNLCAGTVLALGTPQQVAALDDMQHKGELGCFALTEKLAGVSSGLVVNTTAEWDEETQTFILNSPDQGAHKNWISQGLVADKSVVVADLRIKGKSYGPHAFIMYLRDGKHLVPGVSTQDMGRKTVGNDLDNASIAFDKVILPKGALLSKFADIDAGGNYVQKVDSLPVFHMIGQRLFTGRVAVAQAAMAFRHGLFNKTKAFADEKKCWAPAGRELVLSGIPQLKALFHEAETDALKLDAFVGECERRLCDCLKNDTLPSLDLVEAIACAKVKCVEDSIRSCHRLQNEVGSYALMAGTGFENIDFLTCCKFAEGDSRILMQKMSRDRMKRFQKKPDLEQVVPDGVDAADWKEESEACTMLQRQMGKLMSEQGLDQQAAWDSCWVEVYGLAEMIMARTMKSFMAKV